MTLFKTQIFDDIVLNLINTGEVSNSLGITIDEIKKIYKNRFYDKINLLTSLIQPIFLIVNYGFNTLDCIDIYAYLEYGKYDKCLKRSNFD